MGHEEQFKYLQHINSPADLRKLSIDELQAACAELRRDIINELADHPVCVSYSL